MTYKVEVGEPFITMRRFGLPRMALSSHNAVFPPPAAIRAAIPKLALPTDSRPRGATRLNGTCRHRFLRAAASSPTLLCAFTVARHVFDPLVKILALRL